MADSETSAAVPECAAIERWLRTSCLGESDAYAQLATLIETFQEDGTVLDAVLERLVTTLAGVLRSALEKPITCDNIGYLACDAFYRLCKVRGLASVCQLLPVERPTVLWLFQLMLKEHPIQTPVTTPWQVAYVLFGWAELAAQAPFALDEQLTSGLLGVARSWLIAASAAAVPASRFMSRLVTRDTRPSTSRLFDEHLRWLASEINRQLAHDAAHALQNLCYHLALLLKHARNEQDLQSMMPIIQVFLGAGYRILTGHARVKLLKQFGRCLLTLQRGSDVLAQVLEVLENLVKIWLSADTRSRWAAAAAVAGLVRLMPAEAHSDLVVQLLDMIRNTSTSDVIACQSACVLLAELARAQLVPLGDLRGLIDWTSSALTAGLERPDHLRREDQALRDAACYVFWSFARYLPSTACSEMSRDIASLLLCTALYDREVQCRRAAAAALQECAGRWGDSVPCALFLADRVNFYSVADCDATFGLLTNALCATAGQQYAGEIQCYLLRYKLFVSPDPLIRFRAARALVDVFTGASAAAPPERSVSTAGTSVAAISAADGTERGFARDVSTALPAVLELCWMYATGKATENTAAAHHGALCFLGALARRTPEPMTLPLDNLPLWMECAVQVHTESEAEHIVRARCDLLLALLEVGHECISCNPLVPDYLLRSLEHHAAALASVARRALFLYFEHNRLRSDLVSHWRQQCVHTIHLPRKRRLLVNKLQRSRSSVPDPCRYAACVLLGVLVAVSGHSTDIALLKDTLQRCADAQDHASARAIVESLPLLVETQVCSDTDATRRTEAWYALLETWTASLCFHITSARGDSGCWVREAALEVLPFLWQTALTGPQREALSSALVPSLLFLCFDRVDSVRALARERLAQLFALADGTVPLSRDFRKPLTDAEEHIFSVFEAALAADETPAHCVLAILDGMLWASASPGGHERAKLALKSFVQSLALASPERLLVIAAHLNKFWDCPAEASAQLKRLQWPALRAYSLLPRTWRCVEFLDTHCGAKALALASVYAQRSQDPKRLRGAATAAIQLRWYPAHRNIASSVVEALLQRRFSWLDEEILGQLYSCALAVIPRADNMFHECCRTHETIHARCRALIHQLDALDEEPNA
jgi:hypothetical protein